MLNNLTNQDILILIFLIVLIVVVGIICIVLTLSKNEKKSETEIAVEPVEPDINMALATDNIPEISEEAPGLDELLNEEVKEEIEEPTFDEIVLKKEEDQDNKNRSSIEEVLRKMNEDLEKQKYQEIDRYEEEQEENAVISYQELVARKMALENLETEPVREVRETLTRTTYEIDEDYDMPITEEKIEITEVTKNVDKTNSKFSNSDFISPIFGRLENTMEYPTVKKTVEKKTYTEKRRTDGSEETDEFLNTLKEFRKNL